MSSMPAQRPGKSKQDYGTPWDFIKAVEDRYERTIFYDLAASHHNAKSINYITSEQDSIKQDWNLFDGLLWLNPEFGDMAAWSSKCAITETSPDRMILMLCPASIATEWFSKYVFGYAKVIGIRPRLTFDGVEPNPKTGKADPYPKDLMLCEYSGGSSIEGHKTELDLWRWK